MELAAHRPPADSAFNPSLMPCGPADPHPKTAFTKLQWDAPDPAGPVNSGETRIGVL